MKPEQGHIIYEFVKSPPCVLFPGPALMPSRIGRHVSIDSEHMHSFFIRAKFIRILRLKIA